MRLALTTTRDAAGSVLFESRYTHDDRGRLLEEQWLPPGGGSGSVTSRSYNDKDQLVASLARDPSNMLMYVQISAHEEGGRPSSRWTFDGNGNLVGRLEYAWAADGSGTVRAYDKNLQACGSFRLLPTPGCLFDMLHAAGGMPEAASGPNSVRHIYRGNKLESTEIRFPSGQNVRTRRMSYERSRGILTRIHIADEPTGTRTDIELKWTEGYSAVDLEDQFLSVLHQQ